MELLRINDIEGKTLSKNSDKYRVEFFYFVNKGKGKIAKYISKYLISITGFSSTCGSTGTLKYLQVLRILNRNKVVNCKHKYMWNKIL
jgi:hypothetical protein